MAGELTKYLCVDMTSECVVNIEDNKQVVNVLYGWFLSELVCGSDKSIFTRADDELKQT